MVARRSALLTSVLLLGGLSPCPALAQKLIQIPKVERFRLASKAVGDSFEIRVLLPPTIPGETTRFPVVYMTDVHNGFIIDDDAMRLMMIGDVPRFIAVGIGYAAASNILEGLLLRARDLTHVTATAEVGGSFPFILGSPSLWWANEDVMKLGEKYLATHDDLAATVFLGVGGLEEGGSFKMSTNVLRLERMLRAKRLPGLSLTTRIFPDETHTTVAPMNLIRGLVAVFGTPAPEQSLMGKYAATTKSN